MKDELYIKDGSCLYKFNEALGFYEHVYSNDTIKDKLDLINAYEFELEYHLTIINKYFDNYKVFNDD